MAAALWASVLVAASAQNPFSTRENVNAGCSPLEHDINYDGYDLKNQVASSADNCCDMCNNDSECKYFTYRCNGAEAGELGDQSCVCYMKSSDAGRGTSKGDMSGAVSHVPSQPSPPPMSIPTRQIAPDVSMPVVMIGTGQPYGKYVNQIINGWVDLGGHGIDTAYNYYVQPQIAKILKDRGVQRQDVFLTSKLPQCVSRQDVQKYVEDNLQQLSTSYLDLMLIHWPHGGDCGETWAALEDYQTKGALKSIGISNFNSTQIQDLMKSAKMKPAVNQIHYSVFFHDYLTMSFCHKNGITIQAYSPLDGAVGSSKSVFKDPTVLAVANKHGVSAAQVALRWILHRGDTLVFESSNKEHMQNDADLFGFDLDDGDVAKLNNLHSAEVIV